MISKCEYAMSGVVSHKGLLPRLSYLQGYKPTPFLGQSQRNCPSSFYTIYQSPFLSLASPPISAECLYHNHLFHTRYGEAMPDKQGLDFVLFHAGSSANRNDTVFHDISQDPSVHPPLFFLPIVSFLSRQVVVGQTVTLPIFPCTFGRVQNRKSHYIVCPAAPCPTHPEAVCFPVIPTHYPFISRFDISTPICPHRSDFGCKGLSSCLNSPA